MFFESYRDLGDKKGYWKRVRGLIVQYVEGNLTLDTLVQNISEEPRAQDDELWSIFTSVSSSEVTKVEFLRKEEKKCVNMGFMQ